MTTTPGTTDAAVLHVVATIPLDPARGAEAEPALRELAEASRGDEGCLVYDVHASTSVPGVYVTTEQWRSQADLDAHMTQPHVAKAFEVAGPLLTGEVAIHVLSPL